MQLIIISPDKNKHRHWHLSRFAIVSLFSLAILFVFSIAYTAHQLVQTDEQPETIIKIVEKVSNEKSEEKLHAYYAKQLGSLQAEAMRLKALTNKLADMSGLDIEAEGLAKTPQGGLSSTGESIKAGEFKNYINQLHSSFLEQQSGLDQIQSYLIKEDNVKSAIPTGRPIKKGWVSSNYGYRVDPFTSRKVFHHGLDFAGKTGSEVVSVADGIVSWHGSRGGYGEMIEIDHGNGYQTRYAHNKRLVVKLGERIKKGQTIALMGSTGRSTGPHVHFEILRDGKTINPTNFIK